MIGKQILNYKLTRKIGSGGMATVYEGVHITLDTKVAIKVLDPVLAANEGIRDRFTQEARIMASLNHEGITKVVDFDNSEKNLAIVMEFLEGQTLDDFVKENGAINESKAIEIFKPILKAFEYAHSKGIVHRDVKPSNIFITKEGKVKIMDFGIAKLVEEGAKVLTQTGTQMGTPVYMSPEQVNDSKHIDQRTDIYSLGVTLWFMLAGKAPYDSVTESTFSIYKKIDSENLPGLNISENLNQLISTATEKDLTKRYSNCNELWSYLQKKPIKQEVKPKEVIESSTTKSEQTQIETDNAEGELWLETQKKNSIDEYKYYISKYPNGKYKLEASQAIDKHIANNKETSNTRVSGKVKSSKINKPNTGKGEAYALGMGNKTFNILFVSISAVITGLSIIDYLTSYGFFSIYFGMYYNIALSIYSLIFILSSIFIIKLRNKLSEILIISMWYTIFALLLMLLAYAFAYTDSDLYMAINYPRRFIYFPIFASGIFLMINRKAYKSYLIIFYIIHFAWAVVLYFL